MGRFSGSTESFIDQDLAALEGPDGGLDKLLEQLRLWHGGLRVEPGHFTGWSLGARFYPVLYLLTRMGLARDWGTGLPVKSSLLGKMSRLEVHHIFPKGQLYKRDFKRPEVNVLGNFCFLTKDTNLDIRDRLQEVYFPEVEQAHPGALASQWIPDDPELWKIANFRDFLEARKALLAAEVNQRMEELLHGDTGWLSGSSAMAPTPSTVPGGITSEEEETQLEALNAWMETMGLPRGMLPYDFADPDTGEQKAVLDLAWPSGIQEELSQPVAVLLNETAETIAIASQAGFRCFTGIAEFRRYVKGGDSRGRARGVGATSPVRLKRPMISEDLSETLIVNVVVRTAARRVIRRSVIANRDPGAAKRLEIDMKQTADYETKALDALRQAVVGALERKRRLGQYAVVWRGDRPVCIGPDAPAEHESDRIEQGSVEQ